MSDLHEDIAERLLGSTYASLDERTQLVAKHVADRKHIVRNISKELDEKTTFGQRAADAVALFGGSWKFILIFATTLIVWIALNSFILSGNGKVFDPYPYILLNLFLSMLAAVQAPIILMSQNRQSEKDRSNAEHDYEVNLKAELEIMLLHEKVDSLREKQWNELLAIQKEQLKILGDLIEKNSRPNNPQQNDNLGHRNDNLARGAARDLMGNIVADQPDIAPQ